MATHDIAILGSGPGGYVAAIRAAQYGAKVALIEKADLGGTCLNWGCIPSKALLESVHLLKLMRRAEEFGLACSDPAFDLEALYERKDTVVERLRKGVAALMKKNKVDVIQGHGRLTGPTAIEVEGHGTVSAGRIILATGTAPMRPDFLPMDEETVVDSDYFLALTELPESVLVLGGGYIGCEMATILNGLGVEVTVVEMLPRLLPAADGAVSKEIRKVFKKLGIDVRLETKVESMTVAGGQVTAELSGGKSLTADKALVAIGRVPCTADIGLDAAGVKADGKGFVAVNEHFQTNVPTIYAIGDITGGVQLAHVATRQGLMAAAHASGKRAETEWRVIPAAIFTQPEVGQVGLTEEEAAKLECEIHCSTFPLRNLGKAQCTGELDGFFKIVAEKDSGEILGVHVVGPHASDIVAAAALAMQLECTVEELARTIHAHPTLAEGMMESAESWLGLGIHG